MMAKKGQSGQVLTWQLLLPLTVLHVVQGYYDCSVLPVFKTIL